MGIPNKDAKILWVRGAGKCSMCKLDLIHKARNRSEKTLVGENCHIVGDKPKSARSKDRSLKAKERDSYPNLILLCNVHHKIVDDDPKTYTVAKLHQIKSEHELDVESLFKGLNQVDQFYTKLLDAAVRQLCLTEWDCLSDHAVRFVLPDEFVQGAGQFSNQIWRAVWPKKYKSVEREFVNLGKRVDAYVTHYCSHAKQHPNNPESWIQDGSWKSNGFNPRYAEFAEYAEKWRKVSHQLLTNVVVALNSFSTEIRKCLNPTFMISYGRFVINDSMGVTNNLVSLQCDPATYVKVNKMPKRP